MLTRRRVLIGIVILLVVIQLVPVKRSHPPDAMPLTGSPELMEVLRESCFDCHSNHTNYPWYGYVAPASWLVAHDVNEGRRELNFSEWGMYPAGKRSHKQREVWEYVENGEMPLKIYLPLHPEAKLTPADREILRKWSTSAADVPEQRHSEERRSVPHDHDGDGVPDH